MSLSDKEVTTLRMFKPETYAICLDPAIAAPMVEMGLLEWMPPVWGNAQNWSITDAGHHALKHHDGKDQTDANIG